MLFITSVGLVFLSDSCFCRIRVFVGLKIGVDAPGVLELRPLKQRLFLLKSTCRNGWLSSWFGHRGQVDVLGGRQVDVNVQSSRRNSVDFRFGILSQRHGLLRLCGQKKRHFFSVFIRCEKDITLESCDKAPANKENPLIIPLFKNSKNKAFWKQ